MHNPLIPAFQGRAPGIMKPTWSENFSKDFLGPLLVFCLVAIPPCPIPLPFHAHNRAYYCKLVMRQGGWLGGAPTWGSSVVFTTSASSEWMVSKSLFLFPLGCSPLHPILIAGLFQTWW